MFLSDCVRFDSHGTHMPLEVDVTTFLDESVRAAKQSADFHPSLACGNREQLNSLYASLLFSRRLVGGLDFYLFFFFFSFSFLYMLDFFLLMLLLSCTRLFFKSFIVLSVVSAGLKGGSGTLK